MLFYDLELGAWVRTPGSTAPPQMVPCLSVGATYDVAVQFCCGSQIEAIGADDFELVIKPKSAPTGAAIAEADTPIQASTARYVFAVALTPESAGAYFVANPSELTQDAVIQIGFTQDSAQRFTAPLEVAIQTSYIQPS